MRLRVFVSFLQMADIFLIYKDTYKEFSTLEWDSEPIWEGREGDGVIIGFILYKMT